MGKMTQAMEGNVVPVDYFGRCTPARQTYARHTQASHVEVSKSQFYAAIGPGDVVCISRGDIQTGHSHFSMRHGGEVGRVYSGGRGVDVPRFLLTVDFADKRREILANAAQ